MVRLLINTGLITAIKGTVGWAGGVEDGTIYCTVVSDVTTPADSGIYNSVTSISG